MASDSRAALHVVSAGQSWLSYCGRAKFPAQPCRDAVCTLMGFCRPKYRSYRLPADSQPLQSPDFGCGDLGTWPVIYEYCNRLPGLGGYDSVGDDHSLAQVLRVLHAFGYRKSADSLNHGRQFWRHIIGEYLDIVVRQLPPHRCGSAEAVVLPRLSEHLVSDGFGCAERSENRNQETFLVDG